MTWKQRPFWGTHVNRKWTFCALKIFYVRKESISHRICLDQQYGRRDVMWIFATWSWCMWSHILGDPGAVSPVGKKGGTKVFKKGRKSPWVPTLTELFPKIRADAGSWLSTKNALYYCAQSANSFSWVLFVSLYTTAIVSPHLPGSFTKLVRTRETFVFYFPNQKQRNYRWVE